MSKQVSLIVSFFVIKGTILDGVVGEGVGLGAGAAAMVLVSAALALGPRFPFEWCTNIVLRIIVWDINVKHEKYAENCKGVKNW